MAIRKPIIEAFVPRQVSAPSNHHSLPSRSDSHRWGSERRATLTALSPSKVLSRTGTIVTAGSRFHDPPIPHDASHAFVLPCGRMLFVASPARLI
jgi:hypothetical protein